MKHIIVANVMVVKRYRDSLFMFEHYQKKMGGGGGEKKKKHNVTVIAPDRTVRK